MEISFFTGENAFLSNFAEEADGLTNEHRFQAAKTTDPEEAAWVMEAPTPGQAKRRGRKVTLRPDWEEIKDQVMLNLLRKKFEDPDFAARLLATGDATLIEGNNWNDRYWGVCNGAGKNKLGHLLMQVREELR